METIDDLIMGMGVKFRGLWRSIVLHDEKEERGWSVTFELDGEMVETPLFAGPITALIYARKKINDQN